MQNTNKNKLFGVKEMGPMTYVGGWIIILKLDDLFNCQLNTVVEMFYARLRIWDTLHTKVPMEKAYLGHVDLLPRSLDYNAT